MNSTISAALPYRFSNDSVTVTKDGEPFTVYSSQACFEDVKQAIRDGDWDQVMVLMNPVIYVQERSDNRIIVRDTGVFVVDEAGEEFKVPTDLGDTLMLHMDEQLPLTPLVNFALKLNQNPSNRSVQQLFGFIKANNITITEAGDFVAYKGVRADFTDSYTGTIDNSVGQVIKFKRNEVNENPEEVCSYGLHVAAYDYAHTYYGATVCGVTLVVEVNPRDVVAVPVDYNNAKMRVCEYKVVGVSKGERITKPVFTEQDRLDMWPEEQDLKDDDCDEDPEDDVEEPDLDDEEEELCDCDWCRASRGED